MPEGAEALLSEVVRTRYLSRQRRSVTAVYKEVVRQCRIGGLTVPSHATLEHRIERLDPVAVATARHGADAARALQSARGEPPTDRGPAYVTVAIDVASRCVCGLVVTLEAPSSLSVGLCLAHTATDKRLWLEQLGADAAWPMPGKPREIRM